MSYATAHHSYHLLSGSMTHQFLRVLSGALLLACGAAPLWAQTLPDCPVPTEPGADWQRVEARAYTLLLPPHLEEVDIYSTMPEKYDVFNEREWRAKGWVVHYAEGWAVEALEPTSSHHQWSACSVVMHGEQARIVTAWVSPAGHRTSSSYVAELMIGPEGGYRQQIQARVPDEQALKQVLAAFYTLRPTP